MRHLSIAVLMALLAAGQSRDQYNYIATKATTLSNAAEVVTIQQPASGSRTVHFHGAYVSSSVACAITVERDGTAATATALTAVPFNSTTPAAKATPFSGSDVGTGTVIGRYDIAAGGSVSIDLSDKQLFGDGTSKNLSIRTSSISGDVKIDITWGENN